MTVERRRRAQILVTGATGQVGSSIIAELDNQNGGNVKNYLLKTREMLDVSNFEQLKKQLNLLKPDVIINAAGVSDWRAAGRDHIGTWSTLARGVDNLAKLSMHMGISLIHLSSHSVFGMGLTPNRMYEETDPVAPSNFLASAHTYAEHAIMRLSQCSVNGGDSTKFKAWIVRCGPMFSPKTDLHWRSDLTRQVLSAPRTSALSTHMLSNDLRITPTYVPHLAKSLVWLAENRKLVPVGLYHLANAGVTTPYDFASFLRRAIDWRGAVMEPVAQSELIRLIGDRPEEVCKSTPLNCQKIRDLTPIDLPTWQEAIEEFAVSYCDSLV